MQERTQSRRNQDKEKLREIGGICGSKQEMYRNTSNQARTRKYSGSRWTKRTKQKWVDYGYIECVGQQGEGTG